MSPGVLPSGARGRAGGGGVWFSSWYVVSIDTGHIAQSPQSSPRWSPAFTIEPVLFPPSDICITKSLCCTLKLAHRGKSTTLQFEKLNSKLQLRYMKKKKTTLNI